MTSGNNATRKSDETLPPTQCVPNGLHRNYYQCIHWCTQRWFVTTTLSSASSMASMSSSVLIVLGSWKHGQRLTTLSHFAANSWRKPCHSVRMHTISLCVLHYSLQAKKHYGPKLLCNGIAGRITGPLCPTIMVCWTEILCSSQACVVVRPIPGRAERFQGWWSAQEWWKELLSGPPFERSVQRKRSAVEGHLQCSICS